MWLDVVIYLVAFELQTTIIIAAKSFVAGRDDDFPTMKQF
jgi:hypothetical protein